MRNAAERVHLAAPELDANVTLVFCAESFKSNHSTHDPVQRQALKTKLRIPNPGPSSPQPSCAIPTMIPRLPNIIQLGCSKLILVY